MAKIILGCMLTVVAGFIGAAIGLVASLVLSGLLLLVVGDQPGPYWDTIFTLIFFLLIVLGGLGGVMAGWYLLIRPPKTIAHTFNPCLCLKCGYDLSHNETGRCPECGKGIGREQHRYLLRK